MRSTTSSSSFTIILRPHKVLLFSGWYQLPINRFTILLLLRLGLVSLQTVATVNNTGLVTESAGTTTITYTNNAGCKTTALLP
jgi:hypothetical protein